MKIDYFVIGRKAVRLIWVKFISSKHFCYFFHSTTIRRMLWPVLGADARGDVSEKLMSFYQAK